MVTKGNPGDNRGGRSSSGSLFIVAGLCCFFYLLAVWQRSGFGKGDSIALEITKKAEDCDVLKNLEIETHPNDQAGEEEEDESEAEVKQFEACDERYIDYTPCQDQALAMTFPRESMAHRERHCPVEEEKLRCLVPAPRGYVTPFPWPKSRDYVPFANAPHKSLTVEKAVQNWVQFEGNVLRFPGGGSQFPQGADAYIKQLASVIPIDNGIVRTALDTGCGVASWGAYLFNKNVIAMSFAPRDSHEAQVQFALERGVPAVIGVLGTIKLPYPSGAFDMAHCSRCLIPWGENGGVYMMEIDRVLRPGGFWILSGPPINWRNNYEAWQRPKEDLEEEQKIIEDIAKCLCWEKKHQLDEIAIWRKGTKKEYCEQDCRVPKCVSTTVDDVWYKKMELCVNPNSYLESTNLDEGGELKPFPERLNAVPPIIASGSIPELSVESFMEDNKMWQKHVKWYKRINKLIGTGRYRNIMDMNSGLGSFAAALESPKLWVMNVMPTTAKIETLGVVFERGLIGIYHDWCEAFSTYPRSYDLIHANGLFSLYKDKLVASTNLSDKLYHAPGVRKMLTGGTIYVNSSRIIFGLPFTMCSYEDILLEMDRILRPEGAVILRDHADVLSKVRRIVNGMRWNTKIVDHEDGPLITEKVLFAVKQYWVVGDKIDSTISS